MKESDLFEKQCENSELNKFFWDMLFCDLIIIIKQINLIDYLNLLIQLKARIIKGNMK